MKSLQQKCFAVSAGTHALLLVALMCGAAFMQRNKEELPRPAQFLSAADIDRILKGRSTPTPPVAPPPTPPPVAPDPAPPKIEIVHPKPPSAPPTPPAVTREPVVRRPASTKPDVKVALDHLITRGGETKVTPGATKAPTKNTIAVSLENIAARGRSTPKPAIHVDTTQTHVRESVARVSDAVANLQKNLAQFTKADPSANAQEAVADYGLLVVALYQNAWIVPADVADSGIVAQATITVSRDGRVTEARLTKSSGKAGLDKSIQSALNRVKTIAPFPPADKERERTFIIDFNLKAKRLLG